VPTAAAPPAQLTRANLGFLLAKASQRWNELLYEEFSRRGYADVRPAYGSILIPLFEEDGLRMGQLAERARLSKQTMTTLVRLTERAGLVTREPDPSDGRAALVWLTDRSREFQPVAERALRTLKRRVARRLTREQVSQLRSALIEVADV
jgi:DNA-binding MarR family transcriptional regulator